MVPAAWVAAAAEAAAVAAPALVSAVLSAVPSSGLGRGCSSMSAMFKIHLKGFI